MKAAGSRRVLLHWASAAALALWICLCLPAQAERDQCPSGDPCAAYIAVFHNRNETVVEFRGLRNLSDAVDNLPEDVEWLNISDSCFPTVNLSQFWSPSLRQITLTHSGVENIIGTFPPNNSITKLDLSCNKLQQLGKNILQSAPSMQVLNVAGNNISLLPDEIKNLMSLAIAGNPLNCTAVVDQFYDWYSNGNGTRVLGGQDMNVTCTQMHSWLNVAYTLRDAFSGHKIKKSVCKLVTPGNCTCSLFQGRGGFKKNQIEEQFISVNCSGRGLRDLPSLPSEVLELNVSGNKIKSLEPLRNESYKNLERLYADDNLIESLNTLEVSSANLRILSLKRNKIKLIPTYLLEGLFKKGCERIYLGNNYLQCDCATVMDLKEKLNIYHDRFSDSDDIMCEDTKEKVKDLIKDDLCQLGPDEELSMSLMYCLITLEIVLVCTLVGRLIYDARRFHRTGYLPWLSAKMPPLPCDCMLETMSPSEDVGQSRSWTGNEKQWEGESARGDRQSERVPLRVNEDISLK